MKHNRLLTIASLLAILFFSFHHADDVVRGIAPGGFSNLVPVIFLVLWLYGISLVLAERQSGYIITLVLSLLGAGIPILHMMGTGYAGGKIADSGGAFFFVWTLIALGVSTLFSAMLSAQRLWRLRGDKSRVAQQSEV